MPLFPTQAPSTTQAPTAVLRATAVSLVRGGRELLADVDLTIRSGKHWALLGPNGAGKSTLLSLCGAMRHPTRGSVEILGHRLGRIDVRQLRGWIGHVDPRHPLRTPLTVEEVVLTGATGSIELVPRWAPTADQRARLTDLLGLLGIAGIRDSRWPVLSQGERGRALIARALMPEPRLLLLDEPAAGLPHAEADRMAATISDLNRNGMTVLLVEHNMRLVMSLSHDILVLNNGRRIAEGTADAVRRHPDVLAAYLGETEDA
jgi:iron complex transport system ATP-binding protein